MHFTKGANSVFLERHIFIHSSPSPHQNIKVRPCKVLCLPSAQDFKDKWSLEVDADFSGGFSRHRINIEQQPRGM